MSFKDFIFGEMKAAGLAKHTWEPIYTRGFLFFREAFTHKSFRSENFSDVHELRAMQFSMDEIQGVSLKEIDSYRDYNQLEFIGDKQINVCITQYLLQDYPALPAGNLTFSFQKLSSETYFARFATKRKFFDHILMSPFLYRQAVLWRDGKQTQVDARVYEGNQDYNIHDKLVEDACEAFAAALVKAVDLYSESKFGPGMAILFNWTRGIYDELDFDPMDLRQVKAPGMVMREYWEAIYAKRPDAANKFGNKSWFRIDNRRREPGYVPIQAVDPVTGQVIAETIGDNDKDAKHKASVLANKYLEEHYSREIEEGRQWKQKQYQERKLNPRKNIPVFDESDY